MKRSLAESSISFHSASVSLTLAAVFSSRCAIEEVPEIGSITGERRVPAARSSTHLHLDVR
jgi:hypothetical protein